VIEIVGGDDRKPIAFTKRLANIAIMASERPDRPGRYDALMALRFGSNQSVAFLMVYNELLSIRYDRYDLLYIEREKK
jgi:hypothetical protein